MRNLNEQMQIELELKSFKCETCKKSFTRKGHLNDHMKAHSGVKPFKCNTCERSFTRKSSLNLHMQIHLGEKPFKCEACNKRFAQKKILNIHMKTHSGEKPFECVTCKKSFARKGHLDDHKKIHLGEKLFKCGICKKCFTRKSTLNQHMQIHVDEKPFKCEACSKSFTRKVYLHDHMKSHSGELFKCDICEKSFVRKCTLNKHMTTHLDEKSFKRNLFKYRCQLKKDFMNKVGSSTLEKCHICYKQFMLKSLLDEHMKMHTRRNCSLCNGSTEECACSKNPGENKTNSLKDPLNRHRFMFKCQTCFKTVFCRFQLKLHLKIHTDYKCLVCNEDYRNCSCSDDYVTVSTNAPDSQTEKTIKPVNNTKEEGTLMKECVGNDEKKSIALSEMIMPKDENCRLSSEDCKNCSCCDDYTGVTKNSDIHKKTSEPLKEEPVVKIEQDVSAPIIESVLKFEEKSVELNEMIVFKEEPKEEYFEIVENFAKESDY